MEGRGKSQMTKEELLNWEDDWLERECVDEGDELYAWLEEGIELYKKLIQVDPKESRYFVTLAELYLQWGRDEKIRKGNYHSASRLLKQASIYAPTKPDAFYHLSFILADEDQRWEAVLFYAKEALEKGIDGSKRIKLLCNIALAYARLGYTQQAMRYIKEASETDQIGEHRWFMELYMDRIKKGMTKPILLKEQENERKIVSKREADKLKDEAIDGKCIVLDLSADEKYIHASKDVVRLERKEAEILGYLMEHQMKSCSKRSIEQAVWHDRPVSSSAVKRYIASLRRKLAQAMGRTDISDHILVTTEDGYVWKVDIPSVVLRK